jgi:1-acyl-sn-glycerol-3-phosphate acyltransferase
VDRKSPAATIRSLIEAMNQCDEFHLAIAPEGTRKPVKKWKTGFHMIARETGSEVFVGYYDWGRKEISVGEHFILSDNARADMDRIQAHYETLGLVGKHNDGFVTH